MLNFHLGTILFQIVAFLILMAIVAKFALRPLLEVMQKRQDYIDNEINAAEKAREEAKEILAQQKKELENARNEAHAIIEHAKKQSEAEAEEIVARAKERADRMVEEAREEIERERDKAVAHLRDQVAELSVMLAAKVIEKEFDQKEKEKEIQQFVEEVGGRL